jgi:hypothetical protein
MGVQIRLDSVKSSEKFQIPAYAEPVIVSGPRHYDANLGTPLPGGAGIASRDQNLPGGWSQKACGQQKGRGLSRPIDPQIPHDLTRGHLQV